MNDDRLNCLLDAPVRKVRCAAFSIAILSVPEQQCENRSAIQLGAGVFQNPSVSALKRVTVIRLRAGHIVLVEDAALMPETMETTDPFFAGWLDRLRDESLDIEWKQQMHTGPNFACRLCKNDVTTRSRTADCNGFPSGAPCPQLTSEKVRHCGDVSLRKARRASPRHIGHMPAENDGLSEADRRARW